MYRSPRRSLLHRVTNTVSVALGIGLAIVLAACDTGAGTTTPTATPAPTATSAPATVVVKIYLARHPDTDTNPAAVFPVERTVPGPATPTAALEQLFKGPTAAEKTQGYYSPFEATFGLISYCSGEFRDFTLAMDMRGTTPEPGTATLTFCREVSIAGDLDGPRMKAMVTMTLLQFPAIKKVIMLNHQGNCFADLKGGNSCLNG